MRYAVLTFAVMAGLAVSFGLGTFEGSKLVVRHCQQYGMAKFNEVFLACVQIDQPVFNQPAQQSWR